MPLKDNANDVSASINPNSTTKAASVSSVSASNSQGKFYGSSHQWNANTDGITYAEQGSDLVFGTGDYTIEAWVYILTTGQESIYDGRGGTNTNRVLFYVNSANKLANYINASVKGAATSDFPLNEWVHVALVRSGMSELRVVT